MPAKPAPDDDFYAIRWHRLRDRRAPEAVRIVLEDRLFPPPLSDVLEDGEPPWIAITAGARCAGATPLATAADLDAYDPLANSGAILDALLGIADLEGEARDRACLDFAREHGLLGVDLDRDARDLAGLDFPSAHVVVRTRAVVPLDVGAFGTARVWSTRSAPLVVVEDREEFKRALDQGSTPLAERREDATAELQPFERLRAWQQGIAELACAHRLSLRGDAVSEAEKLIEGALARHAASEPDGSHRVRSLLGVAWVALANRWRDRDFIRCAECGRWVATERRDRFLCGDGAHEKRAERKRKTAWALFDQGQDADAVAKRLKDVDSRRVALWYEVYQLRRKAETKFGEIYAGRSSKERALEELLAAFPAAPGANPPEFEKEAIRLLENRWPKWCEAFSERMKESRGVRSGKRG
jgi:hypothetical protein